MQLLFAGMKKSLRLHRYEFTSKINVNITASLCHWSTITALCISVCLTKENYFDHTVDYVNNGQIQICYM